MYLWPTITVCLQSIALHHSGFDWNFKNLRRKFDEFQGFSMIFIDDYACCYGFMRQAIFMFKICQSLSEPAVA